MKALLLMPEQWGDIDIESKLVQDLNASNPTFVTGLGMCMDVKETQLENADWPILVTLLGIMNVEREEQLLKEE